MEHKGDLHPQIVDRGRPRADPGRSTTCPRRRYLEVREGRQVSAGTLLAKTPREVAGTQDITGGLPRVTEIFEARTPRDPAVMAEVAGIVRLGEQEARQAARSTSSRWTTHGQADRRGDASTMVPHGKHLRVHTGDYVKEGDPLVDRAAGAARHPAHHRHRGGAGVPGPRGAVGLPQPARGDRRQAHRDHRLADAAQGEGRDDGRHRPAARHRHRQVRLPGGQRPAARSASRSRTRATRSSRPARSSPRRRSRRSGPGWRRRARSCRPGTPPTPATSADAAAGHHQGGGAVGQLHQRRVVPGDDQGADRGGAGRQGRLPGGPEGERDPGPPGAGRAPASTCTRTPRCGSTPRRATGSADGASPDVLAATPA